MLNKYWLPVMAVIVILTLLVSCNFALAKEDYPKMAQSVVHIEAGTTSGSGVIIGPNTVLTSKHVVVNAESLYVSFYGDTISINSTKTIMIEGADLAIIVIPVPTSMPVIELNCVQAKLMDDITIVGFPLGLGPMFSKGQIAAPDMLDLKGDGLSYLTWAAINHGNSGGPVFNNNNELIAIAHAVIIDEDRQGATIGALTAVAPLCKLLKKEIR